MIAERVFLSYKEYMRAHCIRPATVCGISPRMRFDLTINQFVKEAFLDGFIEVYDADTNRPYCHVKDFAEIISIILFLSFMCKINSNA